jgi:uncharacterized membrane protein YkoI
MISLVFALAAGAAGSSMAQQAMTEAQVRGKLVEQGYTRVHDVKFDDGMWKAHARSGNDKSVEIRIDAKTGEIYPEDQISRLSERDVRASLSTQGYTHVHDVDFDDGMWEAKAENPSGKDVKLRIDPRDGKVIGTD